MTREQMIYQCRQKLPYPISWYDKQPDGVIFHVWNKHIIQGIPIDKRQAKYKEANEAARLEEDLNKAPVEASAPAKEANRQLSFDDIPKQPKKEEYISMQEFARRCINRGERNFITDRIYGEHIAQLMVDNKITVEEFYELTETEPSKIKQDDNGCWLRLTDSGDYDLIPDCEVANATFGETSIQEAPCLRKLFSPQKPGKK